MNKTRPPAPSDPKYQEALAALHRLADANAREAGVASAEDADVLRQAAADLRRCVNEWGRFRRCPACRRANLSVLWADEHVVACSEHPAVKQARRAEREWTAASAVARALGRDLPSTPATEPVTWPAATLHGHRPPADPARPFVRIVLEGESEQAMKALLHPGGPASAPELAGRVTILSDMLLEWGHYLDRARKPLPCPCCGKPFAVRGLPEHIVGCPEHPDQARAEALEAAILGITGGADTGVRTLVDERDVARAALSDLVEASWSLMNTLGYLEHGRSYLRHSDEDAFQAAMRAASDRLAALSPAGAGP